jgi:hypothetical protein
MCYYKMKLEMSEKKVSTSPMRMYTKPVTMLAKGIAFAAALSASVLLAESDSNPVATGDFWKADTTEWGDGRPLGGKPGPKQVPQGFKSDWKIEVPETGWYELYLIGGGGGFGHDAMLDGRVLYLAGSTDRNEKGRNLWLEAGTHTLRLQRIGRSAFPCKAFKHFELRRGTGPGSAITAAKTLLDVMRAGEDLKIEVTGGGTGKAASYELLSRDLQNPEQAAKLVGTVKFSASGKAITKTVKVKCPDEGAFTLNARIAGGRELSDSEFPIGPYAVVDVKAVPVRESKRELVYDIDCVKQTLNGQPIAKGDFIECNGPTRVTTGTAGTYRESHDCTQPEAAAPGSGGAGVAKSFSGFSYKLKLPQIQVPYLMEVEYPDDDQRCIVMGPHWLDPKTGNLSALSKGYNCKSVQTGGMFRLSNQMQMHRAVFWPKTSEAVVTIFSQEIGTRAAVAKIRLYRFPDGNLPLVKTTTNGRNLIHWYEEAHNWKQLVGVAKMFDSKVVTDLVGLNRWAQFVRYHGGSGISALGVGYQSAFWRQTHLPGFEPEPYDVPRLVALVCEKYGLKYMPEVFPNQWYMNKMVLPKLAENPDDIHSVNCNGNRIGKGAAACDLNPLHPVVQNTWIDAIGELADKLRDCPSFLGVEVRANVWQFRGDFTLPGLGWGYGDWIIRQFEQDTGITVPGDLSDSNRFMARYEFLTSPDQRQQWVDWRCERILDYHKRLRDRIRGRRDDVKLVLWGNFSSDATYKLPTDTLTRMKYCGVDLDKVRQAGDIAIMTAARSGSRFVTSKTQGIYDNFFDPDYVRAGMGEPRAFTSYMNYLELASDWPAEKLGLKLGKKMKKPPYHCSASNGAGRNSLERYAVVVAEQDSSLLQEGGNADSFGDSELWRPWFAEFRALPALPFTALDQARDPVAVWHAKVKHQKGFKNGFYFYAVNRARWPVSVDLGFEGCDSVISLTSDQETSLTDGRLVLTLQPFEIRSFRTSSRADIVDAKTSIPNEMHVAILSRLAFAQRLRETIADGTIPEESLKSFDDALATAWQALERKAYWRARSVLRSAPMMRVYELTGSMPEGQIVGKFPNLMRSADNMGHWKLLEPMISGDQLMALADRPDVVSSNRFNPEWGGFRVLQAKDGRLVLDLDIPATGLYTLQFGLVGTTAGPVIVNVAGETLADPAMIREARKPDTAIHGNVDLTAGKQRVVLTRPGGGSFGLYALKVLPKMRALGSEKWSAVGPFDGFWANPKYPYGYKAAGVKAGMEHVYPPEQNLDVKASYTTADGRVLSWKQKFGDLAGQYSEHGVDMSVRTGSPGKSFNFALAYVNSDRDRTAMLMVTCDWWARAYLNGQRLRTNLPEKDVDTSGADFTTHYPRYFAVMHLKKGENKLLVKQQGGTLGSGFGAYISELPGVTVSPVPMRER